MKQSQAYYPRLLMWMAALSPIGLFLFPIWRITLEAPQFPEGLYMYIWVNKISGSSEYVLQNINILNHYIGMQRIEPDAIPELKYFPYVIIGMILLGVLAGIMNHRKWFLSWFILLAVLCVLALVDFYLWEYAYGHNLDPKAPIQVPGMTYQPPLIGEKMLLNFNAKSYPATGFWFLVAALVFSFSAYYMKNRIRKKKMVAGIFVICMSTISGCSPEPAPIHYGEDVCHSCRMSIVDERYGAELVTNKGKVYVFDATECLLQYMQTQRTGEDTYAYLLTNTWDVPGTFTALDSTTWLISEALPSPMGAFLTPFRSAEEARKVQTGKGGKLYDWNALQTYFAGL